MALSFENLRNRMTRDFKLLGLTDTATQADVVCDAVGEFLEKMDVPVIAAELSVSSGVASYSIPETIDKIVDVRDEPGESVSYSIDTTTDTIALATAPADSATYTVYGTTQNVRSNLDAVVAAIPENDEHVLYAYVRAAAYEWAHHAKAPGLCQKARAKATARRKSKNRALNVSGLTVRQRDVRGRYIDDLYSEQGYTPSVSTQFESDL